MMAPNKQPSLKDVDLFLPLSREEVLDLESRMPIVGLAEGQFFYTPWHQGESFFLLLEGRMRLYRTRKNRELTLTIRYAGEFFGESGLTSRSKNTWAQALDPARVAVMGRKALRKLITERPAVGEAMVELLVERLSIYEDMLEEISLKETSARLAGLLVRCVESEGVAMEEGYVIFHYYSHQFMASMIGCERVALTRAIKELREADLIRVSGRRIHVPNLKLLKIYAEEH